MIKVEILTKNLVIFKRLDGVKDEKLFWGSLKNLIFRGEEGVQEKLIERGTEFALMTCDLWFMSQI